MGWAAPCAAGLPGVMERQSLGCIDGPAGRTMGQLFLHFSYLSFGFPTSGKLLLFKSALLMLEYLLPELQLLAIGLEGASQRLGTGSREHLMPEAGGSTLSHHQH